MDISDLYDILSSKLDTYHNFIKSSKEIIIRCPYCGDSIKHSNKGHFYIGESSGTFLYQCKRAECNATGILNKRVIEDLGIFDLELFAELTKINSFSIYKNINTSNNYNLKYDTYDYNVFKNIYTKKMDYLYSRIFNLDEIDLSKYRIILSPTNFFQTYGIKLNSYQSSILMNLEHNSIGLLNGNGSNISFRYIDENSKYRYFKIKLNNETDIYTISNSIDLTNQNYLTINICEGVFDCINIYSRIRKNDNEIYAAANGSDYISKLEYLCKQSGLLNLKINIYRDSDHSVNKIINQFKNSILKDSINIYSNTLEKDYSYEKLFIVKDY